MTGVSVSYRQARVDKCLDLPANQSQGGEETDQSRIRPDECQVSTLLTLPRSDEPWQGWDISPGAACRCPAIRAPGVSGQWPPDAQCGKMWTKSISDFNVIVKAKFQLRAEVPLLVYGIALTSIYERHCKSVTLSYISLVLGLGIRYLKLFSQYKCIKIGQTSSLENLLISVGAGPGDIMVTSPRPHWPRLVTRHTRATKHQAGLISARRNQLTSSHTPLARCR